MRIQQLVLENFRGFEKLEMDFPEGEGGLVVLVGVNGSGKTSVLDAIRKAFAQALIIINNNFEISGGRIYPKFLIPDYVYRTNNHPNDIKHATLNYKIGFHLKYSGGTNNFKYSFEGDHVPKRPNSEILELNKFFIGALTNEPIIFINYPTERKPATSNKFSPNVTSIDKTATNQFFELKKNFLYSFEQQIDFRRFLKWFKDTEDIENEYRLNHDPNFRNKELNIIRNTIEKFSLGFSKPRIHRIPYTRLIVKKGVSEVNFDSLSDGEKIIFAMAGDIALRLLKANPQSNNPLNNKGIVLIDEIELHLHPAWQRKIIPALRRTFPNVQFIVTTHSPQVISTVPKENVFILEDFKLVEKTPFTEGRDSNDLLYNIFGVEERPKVAKEDFQKLYDFLDEENIEKVRANIKEMEAKYGEDDPDIIEAKGHIKDFFELD